MRLAFIVFSVLLAWAGSSNAALVEISSATYYRQNGSPTSEYLEVVLENRGEIRVANVNLQDSNIEPTSATDVMLNGAPLMRPFAIPTGGSTVFPLEAGSHLFEVTLQGKPGGGIKVSFFEEIPDAPVQGVGWELLDDGTVRHRESGLIFHQNMSSPGLVSSHPRDPCGKVSIDARRGYECQYLISEYINALNTGDFGVDPVNGNADYDDWRAPTIDELAIVAAWRAAPPIEAANGDVHGEALVVDRGFPYFQALKPDGPFIFCFFISDELQTQSFGASECEPNQQVDTLLTSTETFWMQYTGYAKNYAFDMFNSGYGPILEEWSGDVWPVRGDRTN